MRASIHMKKKHRIKYKLIVKMFAFELFQIFVIGVAIYYRNYLLRILLVAL